MKLPPEAVIEIIAIRLADLQSFSGEEFEFRWAAAIRGTHNPRTVKFTPSAAIELEKNPVSIYLGSSSPEKMASEIHPTPQWLDTREYPFTSRFLPVNNHRLHYVDEGSGELILFVHGTPSWSFDFRNVIQGLSANYRCMAIDHIGFGLSDKPEHYDYSTQNHSATLEKFVLEKDLKDITLVVHDFGGPIGLSFAIRHPHRIRRIIVLNSWLWSSEQDPEFIRFSRILRSPLLPFLYRRLNFSPRFLLPRSIVAHKLSRAILRHYTRPFADSTQRNGALAFARSLLHDQRWFEELWEQRELLSDKPTLFIWGMKDPVIKSHYLDKFISGFPRASIHKLENCGHFPQEECPAETTAIIRQFVAGK